MLAAAARLAACRVWQRLQQVLLDQLGRSGKLDWSHASLDSISVRTKRERAERPEPDRARQAALKYHLLVDRRSIPLAAGCLLPIPMTRCCWSLLVDGVPPVKGPRGRPGRPRRRPAKLHADKGYDYPFSPAQRASGTRRRAATLGCLWSMEPLLTGWLSIMRCLDGPVTSLECAGVASELSSRLWLAAPYGSHWLSCQRSRSGSQQGRQ
jgi:hypothetical protein